MIKINKIIITGLIAIVIIVLGFITGNFKIPSGCPEIEYHELISLNKDVASKEQALNELVNYFSFDDYSYGYLKNTPSEMVEFMEIPILIKYFEKGEVRTIYVSAWTIKYVAIDKNGTIFEGGPCL